MISQVIFCVTGTLAFAVTMNTPRKCLIYITAGSFISSFAEFALVQYYNDFIACFCAMILSALFCEIAARNIKTPTTVLLIPCIIPLLPGGAIYYTMLYAIRNEIPLSKEYALSTLLSGLGIALGAVVESAVIKIINEYKKK